MKKKLSAKLGLIIALVMTFVSLIGAYTVMTNFSRLK